MSDAGARDERVQCCRFRGGMPVGSLLLGKLIPIFSAPVIMGWSGRIAGLAGSLFPGSPAARGGTLIY